MADDPFFGYQSEQILTASAGLAAAYRTVAEKAGAEFVDTARWRIPMTFDGVHFSEEGHRIFAGHMAALLEK
jgi:lysophospholipase L1-like esterase